MNVLLEILRAADCSVKDVYLAAKRFEPVLATVQGLHGCAADEMGGKSALGFPVPSLQDFVVRTCVENDPVDGW